MTQPPAGGDTRLPGDPNPQPTPPVGAPPDPPAASGGPAHPVTRSPRRRPAPLIAALVLVAAVLLCGGGGTVAYLALRDSEGGPGSKEPQIAVDGFVKAVYQERDAAKAATFVCSAARDDEKIAAKVAEVRRYAEQYQNPRFRWTSPTVDNQTGDRATVSTRVTMTTADEKVAEQALRFTVVRRTGWWVCEVG
ncbi:hypothetical protein [Micromonospora sp. DT31]|uniref:Rv0361 family membrane protein n=1 Tax=Micromonospora sp. DT31 TaxID=3393434 RepID=UPI003CEFC430